MHSQLRNKEAEFQNIQTQIIATSSINFQIIFSERIRVLKETNFPSENELKDKKIRKSKAKPVNKIIINKTRKCHPQSENEQLTVLLRKTIYQIASSLISESEIKNDKTIIGLCERPKVKVDLSPATHN